MEKYAYHGPVTAVELFPPDRPNSWLSEEQRATFKSTQSCLFVGTGPKVRIYSLKDAVKEKQLIAEYNVLPSAVVHGIRFSHNLSLLAVFGQKFCNVYNIQYSYNCPEKRYDDMKLEMLKPSLPGEFRDLILDAQFLNNDRDGKREELLSNDNEIALAFSHNFVEIWSLYPFVRKYCVNCADHCILYSAKFFGYSRSTLIVASGTVFNQILIWDPLHGTKNNNTYKDESNFLDTNAKSINVKYRLEGHKGVLFHIDWDTYGDKLISVSDDRTLRCWELKHCDKKYIGDVQLSAKKFKSELFNSNTSNPTYQFVNAWSAFGHSARVWKCKFFGSGIITCAEDATAIVWNRNGSIETHLSGHAIKNVWCVATSWDGTLAVTGGGDGSVKLWDIKKYKFAASIGHKLITNLGESKKNMNVSANDVQNGQNLVQFTTSSNLHGNESGSKTQVLLLSKYGQYVYSTSNLGHVSRCDINNATEKNKSVAYFCTKDVHAKAISCTLALSPDERYLISGDRRGYCRIVYTKIPDNNVTATNERDKSSYLMEWQAHKTRCWLVCWGGSRRRMEDPSCSRKVYDNYRVGYNKTLLKECVVTTSATGLLSLWHVCSNSSGEIFKQPTLLGTLKTCGKTCFSSIYFGAGYLFCGDNRGNVYIVPTNATTGNMHLFPPDTNQAKRRKNNSESCEASHWLSIIAGGHNRQPIRWTGFNVNSYYSAGHDGYIVEYCKSSISSNNNCDTHKFEERLDNIERSLAIKCIHKAAPITAVESLWWSQDKKSMFVVGTKASDLIIYNLTQKYELLRVEIGGWRRPVDVMPIYGGSGSNGVQGNGKIDHFLVTFVPPGRLNPRGQRKVAKMQKDEVVCICKFNEVPGKKFVNYSLEPSFHGKVGTGVKWLFNCSNNNSSHLKESLAITCAEDNRIKILKITSRSCVERKQNLVGSTKTDCWCAPSLIPTSLIDNKNNKCTSSSIECLQTIELHHSGVRALDVFASTMKQATGSDKKANIVVSVGGNNTICCCRVDHNDRELFAGTSHISMLARKVFESKDGDYRFLSVTTLIKPPVDSNVNGNVYIFVGNSQGYIYCFQFFEENAFVNENILNKSNGISSISSSSGNGTNGNSKNKHEKNVEYNKKLVSTLTAEYIDGSKSMSHKDSSVLKYFYKFKQDNDWQVSPVLDIGSFLYKDNYNNETTIIISGGSNGTLSIWSFTCGIEYTDSNPSSLQTLLFHERVHQCGMNCIDYSKEVDENNCFVIVSGGDDNMFSANIFQITTINSDVKPSKFEIVKLKSLNLNNFCASALKGIRLVNNYIFCAGWNQRMHVGKLKYEISKTNKSGAYVEVDDINFELVGMAFVDVADIGDLDVNHEIINETEETFNILVVGQGIEYLKYHH
jgi:WD40 repeat protein